MNFSNQHFYSVSDYYKSLFGCKVYKLSLECSSTCPNRDGSKAYGGCIFCSSKGSGDFASSSSLSLDVQIKEAMDRVRNKNKGGLYIAYFQSFTSTYGNQTFLMERFTEALSYPGVVGLDIATRPDCIKKEMLDFLGSLSEKTFVTIELGLQTSKEETALYINRQYPNKVYEDTVRLIKSLYPKIHIVTHIIYGLPGESEDDMLNSLQYAIKSGTDGLKIALLHVLKDSRLYELYLKTPFPVMDKDTYINLIGKSISLIPPSVVIHRLTGDGHKKTLVAPLWSENKKDVYNSLMKHLRNNNIIQGCSIRSLE